MARSKRTKKGVLHHVFRILADITCGNSAKLSPGLFVQMYYRVFQGPLQQARLSPLPLRGFGATDTTTVVSF